MFTFIIYFALISSTLGKRRKGRFPQKVSKARGKMAMMPAIFRKKSKTPSQIDKNIQRHEPKIRKHFPETFIWNTIEYV